ncbi:MAG: SRPBCC family protein [Solirubrobacterales bacterium]|nr:SRPBCC family protein [Solirubrobacterales bacterium]
MASNNVHLSGDFDAAPDEVFTFFTERFDEIWPGKMDLVSDGSDPKEPLGLGFVRIMHTPAGALREEIVTHERPRLIEYKVINEDEAKIHNHLGRIEFADNGNGGTKVDYTIDYDYRPPLLGPVSRAVMNVTWAARGKRKVAAGVE